MNIIVPGMLYHGPVMRPVLSWADVRRPPAPCGSGCHITPGNKLSVFSAMVTFLQVKTSERMTNKSFDAMLAAFRKSFPDASELPHTYSKMKNNCVLFQKDYANLSQCPKCKSSRWKDGDDVKRIPHNVLRHFPIIPRL